jgi:hypothetical protein
MKIIALSLAVSVLTISLLLFPASARAQQPADSPKTTTPATAKPEGKRVGDTYPLATCPITDNKLGSMGNPIIKSYDGREVRFCCKSCPPKFEKDLAQSMAKLDEAIVKDQLPLYPTDASIVSGKKLPEKPIDWVYNNRLVRLADHAEQAEFLKNPAKHMAALDKATIEKHIKDYPLKTCPVSKDELGEMGEVKDFVIAGRLIRLCCPDCEKDVRENPAKFIAMIDAARKRAGDKKEPGDHKDDDHHDHKH